ncbi:uncharacterized protein LOC118424802 [Branchiostoma floridae]|uniref:Uncharacterized protein LOC118424802 n=2 Tax=Branchiostoma floridae TaxID=7739 RepID=A0A9J7LWJ2_BRAFL|nr:uncharacterized protein LOC118424802 [Branchiostoma floridae]
MVEIRHNHEKGRTSKEKSLQEQSTDSHDCQCARVLGQGNMPRQKRSSLPGINDFCRLCARNLVILGVRRRSQNLFKLTANSKPGTVLIATRLEKLLGTAPEKRSDLSETICQFCIRKLANYEQTVDKIGEWRRNIGTRTCDRTPKTTPKRTPTRKSPAPGQGKTPENAARKRELKFTPGKSPAQKQARSAQQSEQESENVDPLQNKSAETTVEVQVQFPSDKHPRLKRLDGELKSTVQQLAEGRWAAAANSLLKHKDMTAALQVKVSESIKRECNAMAAGSILGKTTPEDLQKFRMGDFGMELEARAPWLNSCLHGACGEAETSQAGLIAKCTAASVCLRVKHQNLSAIQYRNSIALLHGGAKKVAFARFNKQQICMSHRMSLQKQREFGAFKDVAVLGWKNTLEVQKESVSLLKSLHEEVVEQERVQCKAGLDTSGNSTISSADLQALDFSFKSYDVVVPPPPSLETEDDSDFDLLGVKPLDEPASPANSSAIDISAMLANIKGYREETYKVAERAIHSVAATPDSRPQDIVRQAICFIIETPLGTFQIIFDNVDFYVTPHHQSTENRPESVHWVHQYAAKDRVVTNLPSDEPLKRLKDLNLEDILPTYEVQQLLRKDYIIYVVRVLVWYLEAFRDFKKNAVWHIPHEFSAEMEQQSEQCWLGLQFKNENYNKDMADIMRKIQADYVPANVDEDGAITDLIHPILLGGDLLSEERAANIQAAFKSLDTPEERLDGMIPKNEVWHAGKNLLEIYNGKYFKPTAGADKASLCANMNVIQATNAKKGPHIAYNHYMELFMKDLHASIIYAAKKIFHLPSIDAPPESIVPDMILSGDQHTKSDWIHSRAAEIVDLVFAEDLDVVQGMSLQKPTEFKCRAEGCNRVYVRPKPRVTHELKKHNLVVSETESSPSTHMKEDHIRNYHISKLGMALLINNIHDATREGDGERLSRCFKMALLFYRCHGHTKYAHGTLLHFARSQALLPPSLAHSLVWNRFVNDKGGKGNNVPLDLNLEFKNNLLKQFLKHLGPNLNESNAARVANSIGEMAKLLQSIDTELGVRRGSGYHHKPDDTADIQRLVVQYEQANVLDFQPGREYNSFPGMDRNPISKLNMDKMLDWMRNKLKYWEALHE